jgi:hypothetical protein
MIGCVMLNQVTGGTMNLNDPLPITLYAIQMGWIQVPSYVNGVHCMIVNQVNEVSSTVRLHRDRLLSMGVGSLKLITGLTRVVRSSFGLNNSVT